MTSKIKYGLVVLAAIENYAKSLEMNLDNVHAREQIAALTDPASDAEDANE